MLNIERWTHVPLYVQAVQVTDANMEEVAEWCDGVIASIEADGKEPVDYIKVATIRPIRLRQTQAFVGDWVLKTEVGVKCYMDKAFKRAFIEAPESDPVVLERAEQIFEDAVKT